MLFDLAESWPAAFPDYDVCIVGSGPAGITVACELLGAGLTIALLESGRKKPTRRGDQLRRVQSEGIRIKDYSRERVLGGASTTWAGLSSPLDPIDFEPRPWLRRSGWPIERAELLELYREAAERYRFAPLDRFEPGGFDAVRGRGSLAPAWRGLVEKVFLAAAPAQDFGREQRARLEGPGIDVYLDATVQELEAAAGERRARAARFRDSRGRVGRLSARTFVVATGGIENARLLLLSRGLSPAGLGNEHDQVGRCLMNHPKNYHGLIRRAVALRDEPYFFGCLDRGYAGYAGLRLPEAVQRERALLNSYVRFEPLFPWSDSPGVEALVFLVKRTKILVARMQRRARGQVVVLRDYAETGDDSKVQNDRKRPFDWIVLLARVVRHPIAVATYLYYRLREGAAPPVRTVRVRNFMEMEPDPENRVALGTDLDPDGQPIAVVRHRATELDRRSLIALHDALRAEVERAGLGKLESDLAGADPWPIDDDASHHMGTTRMGTDPRTSVVDPDLKLHAVENVYLAGASVFPTSGCANPTLTIVALAIRLARHLRRVLAPAAAKERA